MHESPQAFPAEHTLQQVLLGGGVGGSGSAGIGVGAGASAAGVGEIDAALGVGSSAGCDGAVLLGASSFFA